MAEPRDRTEQASEGRLHATRLVRPLAALAVLAVLLGRALGPAAAGIGVGMDATIHALELGGGVLSQLFAVAATVTALALILARVQSPGALFVRIASVALGSLVVMQALRAPAMRLGDVSALVIGAAAPLLALVAAWDARRVRFAWPVTAALALTAVACLLRLTGLAWSTSAEPPAAAPIAGPLALATAGFVATAAALAIGVTWSASRSRKLASPATVVALALSLFATQLVFAAVDGGGGAVAVLVQRAAERLLAAPEPFVSASLRVFVAVAGPLTAIAVLLAPRQVPALSGGLALVLLVQSSSDIPALSLALVVAALGLDLAAHDARGFWQAAAPARSAPPEGGRAGSRDA